MNYYNRMSMLREFFGNWRNFIPNFIANILYLVKRSMIDREFAELRNHVLSLPEDVKREYAEECAFVESLPPEGLRAITFPYPETGSRRRDDSFVAGKEKGLPYVVHGNGAKLFFPRYTPVADAISEYRGLVEREGLLGTGILAKSPHCYQNGDFRVEQGDILLDIGSAEAIFALDNMDKVSKAYLFESLPEWKKPLRRTFSGYGDKVVLVPKLVADRTKGNSTTLMDVVKDDVSDSARFFVKMDIEGWERTVIKGNADFFKSAKIKLGCCVYHRQDDARVIESMLKDMGYRTRYSEGYMLLLTNGTHYPYFRHGIIYARNY